MRELIDVRLAQLKRGESVDDFFSFFRDVALDFGNFAVLDGDIGNAVNRIQRIDDPSILEK